MYGEVPDSVNDVKYKYFLDIYAFIQNHKISKENVRYHE